MKIFNLLYQSNLFSLLVQIRKHYFFFVGQCVIFTKQYENFGLSRLAQLPKSKMKIPIIFFINKKLKSTKNVIIVAILTSFKERIFQKI